MPDHTSSSTTASGAGDEGKELPLELPDGITLEDAERITELAEEDGRPSTQHVYESKWSLFAS